MIVLLWTGPAPERGLFPSSSFRFSHKESKVVVKKC